LAIEATFGLSKCPWKEAIELVCGHLLTGNARGVTYHFLVDWFKLRLSHKNLTEQIDDDRVVGNIANQVSLGEYYDRATLQKM
jgi:hypothetical protein